MNDTISSPLDCRLAKPEQRKELSRWTLNY